MKPTSPRINLRVCQTIHSLSQRHSYLHLLLEHFPSHPHTPTLAGPSHPHTLQRPVPTHPHTSTLAGSRPSHRHTLQRPPTHPHTSHTRLRTTPHRVIPSAHPHLQSSAAEPSRQKWTEVWSKHLPGERTEVWSRCPPGERTEVWSRCPPGERRRSKTTPHSLCMSTMYLSTLQ